MANPYQLDRNALAETVGDVPRMATVQAYDPITEGQVASPAQIRHGPGGRAGFTKVNLAAVIDVLGSYGMDPAEEIAKALNATKPVLNSRGEPVLDPKTGEPMVEPVMDVADRAKIHMELLQYTRPKLKAVEVQLKEPELTDEQIDRRLERLMAQVAKKGE